MPYQVQIHHVASQRTAVVRLRARQSELALVVPRACGEVWTFIRSSNLAGAGRHVALYLDGEMNIEVGVEMAQPFEGNDRVVCSSTPAGMVATAVHIGPYNRLSEAHDAIHQWCAAQGYALAGPSWEIYGHWHDDTTQPRTDVFYLLQTS
jgi:effector-binding domain-containing protein